MWINDLVKAMKMLEDKQWNCCVAKIHDNIIRMTNGKLYYIPELVEEYNKKFGDDF